MSVPPSSLPPMTTPSDRARVVGGSAWPLIRCAADYRRPLVSTSAPPSERRSVRRAAAPLAVLAALLGTLVGLLITVGGSSVAHAANELAESTPEDGATVPPQLAQIVLVMTSDVTGEAQVALVCDNNPFEPGNPTVGADARTVTIPLNGTLPEGECNLTWQVFDADNELDGEGRLSFDVSASAAATGTEAGTDAAATGSASTDSSSSSSSIRAAASVSNGGIWLGRVLSIIGISVLFGSLVLIVAAWPEGPEYVLALRFLRTAWIIGAVGTIIYVVALSAAVKGESFGSGLNPGAWFDLFDAGWGGRAAVMRIVFVAASFWVVARPERVIDPTTNMLALGIPALAVITLGLSRTGGSLAALGVLASIAHVLAISVWFGGVVLLARVVLAGPGEEDLVHAVHGFGRISNPAIVITVISGLVQLYRQVGGELFTTGHGRVLLLKTVAVAAMLFVGMTARQVARAKLARANELSVRNADRMRRAFGTEAGIGLVVILLTGWLLTMTPGKVPAGGGGNFAIHERVIDTPSGIDLDVYLEPGTVGQNRLVVRVNEPETGLTDLSITFRPPAGSPPEAVGVTQAIPELTGRDQTAGTTDGNGIPLMVAGTWMVTVSGATAAGSLPGGEIPIVIANADGSLPEVTVAPIPNTPTTQPNGPILSDPPPSSDATATTAG